MTCGAPGCRIQPEFREQVKASRTDELHRLPLRREPAEGEAHVPEGVALVNLCPAHRAEFERLGWLVPLEDEEDC